MRAWHIQQLPFVVFRARCIQPPQKALSISEVLLVYLEYIHKKVQIPQCGVVLYSKRYETEIEVNQIPAEVFVRWTLLSLAPASARKFVTRKYFTCSHVSGEFADSFCLYIPKRRMNKGLCVFFVYKYRSCLCGLIVALTRSYSSIWSLQGDRTHGHPRKTNTGLIN